MHRRQGCVAQLQVQDGKLGGEWPIDLYVHYIEIVAQGPLKDEGLSCVVDMAVLANEAYFRTMVGEV